MVRSTETIARRLRIQGRVQGVGYRAWTVGAARQLGLDGWVRNRHDGSVEALAVGPPETIQLFIDQCRKGPPLAAVDSIDIEEAIGITPAGFTQKSTV